jgi:hypothetical protein
VYVLAIVGVLTWVPLDETLLPGVDVLTVGEHAALAFAHGMLFVPLGFLYPLTREGWEPTPLPTVILGLVVGGALAATHRIEGDWLGAATNVIAAGSGAGIGAALLADANRRIQSSARLAGRLSLEIPLVALIYLLLPLGLAASMLAIDQPLLIVPLVPLGLLGARFISAVQEHHFGPGGAFRTRGIAVVAAGWMALSVFPLVLNSPLVGLSLVAMVALATAHEASIPAIHGGPRERRFEAEALRSGVPYVAAYFATTILLPLSFGMEPWHVAIGFTGAGGDLPRQLLRVLGPIAALTVLGYMLAEARGRRERPFRETIVRIVAECGSVALAMEVSRAFQRGVGGSIIQFVLLVGASVLGAGIYHQQRERIHWILIHQPGARRAVAGTEVRVV